MPDVLKTGITTNPLCFMISFLLYCFGLHKTLMPVNTLKVLCCSDIV